MDSSRGYRWGRGAARQARTAPVPPWRACLFSSRPHASDRAGSSSSVRSPRGERSAPTCSSRCLNSATSRRCRTRAPVDQYLAVQHFRICGQPQKAHLRNTAKTAALLSCRLQPGFGRAMMLVRFKGERQPEIDVRKEHPSSASLPRHLPRQGSRQFADWSVGGCRGRMNEPAGTGHAVDSSRLGSRVWRVASPSPPSLREWRWGYRKLRRRFVLARQLPCPHYDINCHSRQYRAVRGISQRKTS